MTGTLDGRDGHLPHHARRPGTRRRQLVPAAALGAEAPRPPARAGALGARPSRDRRASAQSYGILTPYTSFLVLESDEDRERYGVARTVQMRDGEAFFAAGHDKVALEMLREHTRKARAWRQGLRRKMQKEIAGLGRDLVPTGSLVQVVAVGEQLEDHAWGAESKGGAPDGGRSRRVSSRAATPPRGGGPPEQARRRLPVRGGGARDHGLRDRRSRRDRQRPPVRGEPPAPPDGHPATDGNRGVPRRLAG